MEEMSTESDDRSLVGQDLRNEDLRHFDLSDKVLFQADLRGAKLYGAKVSIKCAQFDGVRLDQDQVAQLLLLIQSADIDPKFQVGLRDLVKRVIGEARFKAIYRWLHLV